MFDTASLDSPIAYRLVGEGKLAAGSPTPEYTHLATLGLFTCKAVSLHNPETNFGVLAHVNGTSKPDKLLGVVQQAYGNDLNTADVKIVQATVDLDEILWPSTETIANFFMRLNPRSLMVDGNNGRGAIRNLALDLRSGEMQEVDPRSTAWQSSVLSSQPDQPIRRMGIFGR